jgi:hypothetical protein
MWELSTDAAALRSEASQLARIFGAIGQAEACWLPEDLPDLLRYQWNAPMDSDLAEAPGQDRDETLAHAARAQIRTFGDLLSHPSPPVPLLKLAKDFFKKNAGSSKDPRPECQVAYLFYLLVILAARTRAGTAISGLADAELERGVKWSLNQAWVQGAARDSVVELSKTMSGG